MNERVLVVDDDEDMRDTIRSVLEDEGVQAGFAAGGAEVLRRLAPGGETPALILLDVSLPGLDGLAVAEWIRRQPHLAATRVVLTTGFPIDQALIVPPVVEVLRKPFAIERLLELVFRLAGAPTPASP